MTTIQSKLIERLERNVKDGRTTFRQTYSATGISQPAMYYYRTGKRIMNLEQYTALQTYLNNLNK